MEATLLGTESSEKQEGEAKGAFCLLCMFAVAVAAEQEASPTPHPPWLLVRVRLLEVSLLR